MEPESEKTQAFYRWLDPQGRLHVASSLDAVPASERAQAERVTLNGATALHALPAREETAAWQFDYGSFGLGLGAALLSSLLFRLLPNGWRGPMRVVAALGVAALLTALYLGSVRRAAGVTTGGALASPSALIQDAKDAVQKLNERQKQQDEELRELQAGGH